MVNKLTTWINKYLSFLDEHTLEVLQKSSSSMLVRVSGMAAGFIISVILGRTIGADGLGIINLSNKIIGVLGILTMFGMDNVVRKEVAIAYEQKDWQHVANTIYTSLVVNVPMAIFITIFFLALTPWLSHNVFNEPELKIPLIIALCLIVPRTLSRIFAMGINGFRKIWQSNLVKDALSSVAIVFGLILMWFVNIEITVVRVAILYGIGRITVTLAVGSYWKKLFTFSGERELQTRSMLKVALPLLIVSASGLIANSADTLMLGWLSTSKEVGLYTVSSRLALLTSFFHMISISTLSPKIASLYGEDKIDELELMVQRVTRFLIWIGVGSVIVFYFLGEHILSIWGKEFPIAFWVLVILSIGQLVNIGTGATGIILMMTDYEKHLGYVTTFSAIINLCLNFFLIPILGGLGAAVSTASTVIVENGFKFFLVKNKLGINMLR